MLKIIIILFVAAMIIFIEYPTIKQKNIKSDKVSFFMFLIIGIGINLIANINIKVPSLIKWLKIVYQPISQLVTSWLS